MTTHHRCALSAVAMLAVVPFAAPAQEDEPEFTDDFPVEDCTFTPFGGNDFCSGLMMQGF